MLELFNWLNTSATPSSFPIMIGYIDPGTGSILLQYLIAALIGGALYFKKFIAKVLRSFLAMIKREKH